MSIILDTFKKTNSRIPIWFMRQAGRYMLEYREIRSSTKNFLDLCYNPQKSSLITLQPIKRFGFDAAIIFSDILVVPDLLGWPVNFIENEGPVLKKFSTTDDLLSLEKGFCSKINNIYESINIVRTTLDADTALIGFAGSPWTIVTYMLEGKGRQNFDITKRFLYDKSNLLLELIEFITEATIEYLLGQIRSGVNLIQLFDSWAGILPEKDYDLFVVQPTKHIVSSLKKNFPHIPIIGFPRGSGFFYERYICETCVDAISFDQFTPVHILRKWQETIIVQGNLDPYVLLCKDTDLILDRVNFLLEYMKDKNFIFNLGHGIIKDTPIKNVELVVDYVKTYTKVS